MQIGSSSSGLWLATSWLKQNGGALSILVAKCIDPSAKFRRTEFFLTYGRSLCQRVCLYINCVGDNFVCARFSFYPGYVGLYITWYFSQNISANDRCVNVTGGKYIYVSTGLWLGSFWECEGFHQTKIFHISLILWLHISSALLRNSPYFSQIFTPYKCQDNGHCLGRSCIYNFFHNKKTQYWIMLTLFPLITSHVRHIDVTDGNLSQDGVAVSALLFILYLYLD
jgi:hypothetical protein